MTTIDERGRAGATELRRSMADGFDLDASLARVRREESVVQLSVAEPPRRVWMLAAVAAVAIAVAGVGVVALRDRSEDVQQTPPVTAPTASTVPQTFPEPTTSTTPTPTPTPTIPGPIDAVVDDAVQTVAPARTVIATAGLGSGPGQLAIEQCQECDPARPWAPVLLLDGRALVADAANHRWVAFAADGGATTAEFPWTDGVIANTQPVVDDAGTVYVVMYGPIGAGGTMSAELWVFDPSDLTTPVSRHAASPIGNSAITFDAGAVEVDGAVIDGVVPRSGSRPAVTLRLADPADPQSRSQVALDRQGVATTFTYAPGELISWFGPQPVLADGTVLVRHDLDNGVVVDRLFPDGRVVRSTLPFPGSAFGAEFADLRGITRLEPSDDGMTFEIAHYDLPA